jgi:YegS/Rv2252/BmrU family lipid kinase
MKAFVVLNPVAGQHDPDATRASLSKAEDEGRWQYELYETTGKEDLQKVVREALRKNAYDVVVAGGGDGTVSGVADGLGDAGVPLGVLPLGTVNAFATEIGIPDSLEAAIEVILGEHQVKTIDAIQSGGRYYLLHCSFGLMSASIADVKRSEKDKFGWFAYLASGIRKLIGIEPVWVTFDIDGQKEKFKAIEVILVNSDQLGVVDEHLGVNIKIDDGVLDLYTIRSKTMWDLIRILVFRTIGKLKKAPHMGYWPVQKSVRIATDSPKKYQADGDIIGETPVTLEVAKGAIKVVTKK